MHGTAISLSQPEERFASMSQGCSRAGWGHILHDAGRRHAPRSRTLSLSEGLVCCRCRRVHVPALCQGSCRAQRHAHTALPVPPPCPALSCTHAHPCMMQRTAQPQRNTRKFLAGARLDTVSVTVCLLRPHAASEQPADASAGHAALQHAGPSCRLQSKAAACPPFPPTAVGWHAPWPWAGPPLCHSAAP